MDASAWAMLGALSLLWAGSFLFYKILATQLPPLTTVLGRSAIGAASLGVVVLLSGGSLVIPREKWPRLLVLAVLNNVVPFTLFAWAEQRVSSGTAAILNAMTPIFALLVAAYVLRSERLTPARAAGIACGFLGVAVLIGPQALLGQDLLGQIACLLAAVSYGFGVPYGRTVTGLAPAQIAIGQLVASTTLLIPLVLLADRPWTTAAPDATGWAALLGLGVLSTGLAYLIFFRILARAGATNLALVTFLIPVTSLILGNVLLGEPVTLPAIGGILLIACGLAAIDGRLLRLLPGRKIAGERRGER
jgi:drug/metabolite transporter (DMT)-like permease